MLYKRHGEEGKKTSYRPGGIFANHPSKPRTCQELSKLTSKTQMIQSVNGQRTQNTFQQGKYVSDKHRKWWPPPSTARETRSTGHREVRALLSERRRMREPGHPWAAGGSGDQPAVSHETNMHLAWDPAIALVGTYPREIKTSIHTKTCA